MVRVILGVPQGVRAGANQLAQAADAMNEHGTRLRSANTGLSGTWSGPAAVAFGGGIEAADEACRAAGSGLQAVADAGHRYADLLQSAQEELLRLAAQEAHLGQQELELHVKIGAADHLLPTLTPAPTPTPAPQVAALRDQLADVAATRARVEAAAEEIIRRHETGKAAFTAALEVPAPHTVADVLGMAPEDVTILREAWSKGKKTATQVMSAYGGWKASSTLAAIERGPAIVNGARAAEGLEAGTTLRDAATEIVGPEFVRPTSAGTAVQFGKAAFGRLNLGLTMAEGVKDAWHGDSEHGEVRDVTTRIAGAGGAVGAGILLLSATNPVGMALVAGYGAYKLGTWAYDNREAIAAAATNAWRRVAPVAEAATKAAGKKIEEATKAVGEKVEEAAGAVVDTARGVMDAAKDKAGEVRDGIGNTLRTLVPMPRFGW